jgi:hypothetical protein
VQPAGRTWAGLLQRSADPLALSTRRELGLSDDRPVILSGHQPGLWHAGILAKVYALAAAARSLNAQPAWLVVDQDSHDFLTLRVPVGRAGDGSLAAAAWSPAPKALIDRLGPEVSASALPAFVPEAASESLLGEAALPSVRDGLVKIQATLAAHVASPSAAWQYARAAIDLAGGLDGPLLAATALARTSGMGWLLEQLRADPLRAARTYNAAVAARPSARIAPLLVDEPGQRVEVPIWIMGPTGRRRGFASDLAGADVGQIVPRALLQTAFCRLFAGDLFIHGTGGAGADGQGGYDAVTAEWIAAWLGRELAPAVTVSATLRLPLSDRPPVTVEQVARADWLAHRARHDPLLLAEPGAAYMKRTLARMASDRRRLKVDRAALFRRMRELVAEVVAARAERPAQHARSARELRERLALDALPADRTWPFPFHSDESLAALRAALAANFA